MAVAPAIKRWSDQDNDERQKQLTTDAQLF